MKFENYVNYAGSKTVKRMMAILVMFENYVNYAGSKTVMLIVFIWSMFENYGLEI